jgi:hypothetical protein
VRDGGLISFFVWDGGELFCTHSLFNQPSSPQNDTSTIYLSVCLTPPPIVLVTFDQSAGMQPAAVGYRYRKFGLGPNLSVFARCELHGNVTKQGRKQRMTAFALNEWDSAKSVRHSHGGVEVCLLVGCWCFVLAIVCWLVAIKQSTFID